MRAIAVIGANFGDEGKGRIVDQLVSQAEQPAIVVRYNGGSQAGHTVVTSDKKHTFSHFGSGTIAGADTYLSKFFISNPFLYVAEMYALKNKGIDMSNKNGSPRLVFHPHMPVSTPYDMLINREVEKWRGAARHGSCGYGVAETVERLCNSSYKTFINRAIDNMNDFKRIVEKIRDDYTYRRLAVLGIRQPTDWLMDSMNCVGLFDQYCDALQKLIDNCHCLHTSASLLQYETVVFEGSQGLCLDERHRFFPHVTRSKTGLTNVETTCKTLNIREIEVVYVTRAYLTRHGAGPLPTEDQDLYYEDLTNVENEWQGKLRFGHLDIDLLTESIRNDVSRCKLKVQPTIAVTCFDQVPKQMKVKCKMQVKEICKDALPTLLSGMTGIKKIIVSRSRQRKNT